LWRTRQLDVHSSAAPNVGNDFRAYGNSLGIYKILTGFAVSEYGTG